MSFPTSPTNGDTTTVNGIGYIYNASARSWTRTASPLVVLNNLTITNLSGTQGSFTGNLSAAGIVGTTYFGQINIGTTSINLNRASGSQTLTGIGIDGTAGTATNAINTQITSNISSGTAYVSFVNSTSGNAAQNVNTSLTYNPNSGNLRAYGIQTDTGVYWAGNGVAFSSGGGVFTTNTAPPLTGNIAGDQWYDTGTDVLFTFVDDGSSKYWLDISTQTANANAAVTGTVATIYGNGTFYGSVTVNINNNAVAIANGGTSGVGNIGASGSTFNTIFAKATSAQYADLAEIYKSDENYDAGTVVVFGGTEEITITNISHDPRVAGVVSTNPAYIMNSDSDGLPVALTGRVPCFVRGPVAKGDIIVTSSVFGIGQRLSPQLYQIGCVIGKSLEEIVTDETKKIEIVVGRF